LRFAPNIHDEESRDSKKIRLLRKLELIGRCGPFTCVTFVVLVQIEEAKLSHADLQRSELARS
jgi:hypothetical protein